MDCDRIVEIGLGRPHSDCNRKTLQHLVGTFSDYVTADDTLLGTCRYQLHG